MTNGEASHADTSRNAFITRTAEIVGAFVRHNAVPAAEMPSLIRTIHATLLEVGRHGC